MQASTTRAIGLGVVLLLAPTAAADDPDQEPIPAGFTRLEPGLSPPDNPLKGLVPYDSAAVERFPHSLEFFYLPLSELMTGPDEFAWATLDERLDRIADRGCQAVVRVWLEYPDQPTGVPRWLLDAGVKLTDWRNPHEKSRSRTPDYADERLVAALERFIAAFGARYDDDPRLGYVTARLLGSWGEWHTWPRSDLFASRQVQARVLDAYEAAFDTTPILLRYPRGDDDDSFAPNASRPFGYHDDSFAWATLPTGDPDDFWYFLPALAKAGPEAEARWRTAPIGGEIRPELWGRIFDADPGHEQAQDFDECVRRTHATWLMDSGMFREEPSAERYERAVAAVRRMGYDFRVQAVRIATKAPGRLEVELRVLNEGVAPFYRDWPLTAAAIDPAGRIAARWPLEATLRGLQPDDAPRAIRFTLDVSKLPAGAWTLGVGVPNPLSDGRPIRFANAAQDRDAPGWLSVGDFRVP